MSYIAMVKNFHLCFQHSDGMRSPRKRRSVPQHDDQSKEHHHEGANVDLFKEFKTARANVQEIRLEPRLRLAVASATREERSH